MLNCRQDMNTSMAEDPYKVLGVARDASEDDLRKAYRKLAKENHPDLNPVNRAQSEERLKTINGAFAILGDATKRRQFDQGLIDAQGEPRRGFQRSHARGHGAGQGPGHGSGQGGEEFGFGDIFSDLFGRGRPGTGGFAMRGQDVRYTLDVEFLEAAAGTKKRVTLPEGGVLDLTVPEGVIDGQVLRLKGKGLAGVRGGEAGDALVEIKVKPHAEFRRSGDDVVADVPITIDEAVLGGKIEVVTINGRVQWTIPKGTSSGQAFRLKGKGIKNAATGVVGDQIITVRIVLPQVIDDKLSYFLSEWRQSHGYNPRQNS
jgi:DnaJ-class molecular chaperone